MLIDNYLMNQRLSWPGAIRHERPLPLHCLYTDSSVQSQSCCHVHEHYRMHSHLGPTIPNLRNTRGRDPQTLLYGLA